VAGRFPIITDENSAKGIAKGLIDREWDVVRGELTVVHQGIVTDPWSGRDPALIQRVLVARPGGGARRDDGGAVTIRQ
jgi:hypothetical protein